MDVTVKNLTEWEKRIEDDDLNISTIIVESILKNLNSPKRFVYIMGVVLEDDNETFDITLDKKYFAETLQEHLSIQERNQEFRTCAKIMNALSILENIS